jgi:hypothetical protein
MTAKMFAKIFYHFASVQKCLQICKSVQKCLKKKKKILWGGKNNKKILFLYGGIVGNLFLYYTPTPCLQ